MKVTEGEIYENLKTNWSWRTKSGERIWRCTCQLCQQPCYVKEQALLHQVVSDCGCTKKS